MYIDTITLFNRKKAKGGRDTWYATMLENVNLNIDRGAVVKAYGEQSVAKVILNVKLDGREICGLRYMLPKEWQRQADPTGTITFQSGENADFFLLGEWDGDTVISDDGYGVAGFRDYMERNHDRVYEVASVSEFSVIPHLEVTGK